MKKIIYVFIISLLICPLLTAQRNDNPQLGEPISAYLNLNNISTKFKNTGISDFNINGNYNLFLHGNGKLSMDSKKTVWDTG